MPACVRQGTRIEGESSSSSLRASASSGGTRISSNSRPGEPRQQPAAQRPRRVVLAADGQRRSAHGPRPPAADLCKGCATAARGTGTNRCSMLRTRPRSTCAMPLRIAAGLTGAALSEPRWRLGDRRRTAPPRRGVRSPRARRPHASASRLRCRQREDGRSAGGRARRSRVHHAVRDAAAIPQGRRGRAAARAARRADVGAFRHAAARDRAHDAGRPRRLHHRLAQRARRAARSRAVRARRVRRARHEVRGGDGTGCARRGDLPALRGRARRDGAHGRGRPSGNADQPHADGRADRLPDESDGGQPARDLEADRLVRAHPHRDGSRPLSRRRCGASIPGSCSSRRS